MKNIFFIFICFILSSYDTRAQDILADQAEASAVDRIYAEFEKYKLNAPWVCDECSELSLSDFEQVWQTIVGLLAGSSDRWFYFSDNMQQYIPDAKECIWQCKMYDQWLRRTYVDYNNDQLYTIGIDDRSKDFSLFDYLLLSNGDQADHPIFVFYAFYIDCLTQVFQEYIENMRIFQHEPETCSNYWLLARVALSRAESLLPVLKKTAVFEHYQMALKSLKQVQSLAEDDYGLSL